MKVLDKKVGNTTYYKYRINLPKEIVENNNLLDKEMRISFKEGKIIIDRKVTY